MKRIASSSRRRPYVFSFYNKSLKWSDDCTFDFPCMTHAFYCDSFSCVQDRVKKLLSIYESLGIYLEARFEDSLDAIDVDSIVQHYNTQLSFDF